MWFAVVDVQGIEGIEKPGALCCHIKNKILHFGTIGVQMY